MIITKIETQKKNNERVNIYINEEFAFGLSLEIVYTHSLKKGMTVDSEFLNNVLLNEEKIKANSTALRFLGYRMRAEKEIIDRLKKDDFEDEIIENTLEYLKRNGLINDFEFAKAFTMDKIKINNYGPQKIKYDLYQKGIHRDIVDEVLESLNNKENEYERCLETAEKKISSYKNNDNQSKYIKLSGYLQRRGFSYPIIKDVLKELIKW